MGSRQISEAQWQKLENSSHEEQRQFLNQYKFTDEPVSSAKRNVHPGDHIYHPGAFGGLYQHHILVYKVVGNFIYYYDYSGPRGDPKEFVKSASIRSNSYGSVQVDGENCVTFEALEKKQAKIRHWPEELKRYSFDEVIERAESRISEKQYSILTNNCEHFVTWCICGLRTSLQITPTLTISGDVAAGVVYGLGASAIAGADYALYSNHFNDKRTQDKKEENEQQW